MKTSLCSTMAALALVIATFASPVRAEIRNTDSRTRQIDHLVEQVLGEQKLKPNAPITDEQFVRRIHLAIIGRIPTATEAKAFLESGAKDKRERLIDRLLESEGYVSHFYNYWADILRLNSRLGRSSPSNEYAYKHWVKESLRSNKPYNQFVAEMIAPEGYVWENGATGYYHRDRGMPLDNMANTVRVFLGTRLECAQCHDHPFDKWKQKEFFEMASFSFGVRTGYSNGDNGSKVRQMMNEERREEIRKIAEQVSGIKGFFPLRRDADIKRLFAENDQRSVARRLGIESEEKFREINEKVNEALRDSDRGNRVVSQLISDIYNPLRYASMTASDRNSRLPHDYQYKDASPNDTIEPDTMFGDKVSKEDLEAGYLPAYAKWMTSKTNPRFTRVVANRLWKKAFGIGLVEPVDQFMDSSEPSNPALMDYLEQSMKDLDFDLKSFLAMIFKSRAWQRQPHSGEVGPGEPFYFSGPVLQRMSAEQIWDSVATLIIPDPDHYQPNLGRELQAIDSDRKVHEALESRPPEEFKKMIDGLSTEVKASYAEQEKVRAAYIKARQDEDEERTRELSGQLRTLTGELRRKISQVAYNGADGRARDMNALMAGAGIAMMAGDGEAKGGRYVRTSLPRIQPEPPEGLSRQEQNDWQRQQRDQVSSWGRVTRDMMRASELPTPAPRGHFLREFGQSDRELIENANGSASVPQALNLMNGNLAEMLRHPYSVLGQALEKCRTPREEIATLYQLMLTRQPTEAETARLLREYESNPKQARANIIWALLNTQQFIFAL